MSEKKTSVESIDRPLDLAKRADLMADKLESWAHRVAEWILDQPVETEPNAKEKLPIVMGLGDCLPKEDIVSLEEYLRWHKPEVGNSLAEERRELVARSVNLLKRSNAGAFFLFVNALTGGAREVACKLRNVAALIRSEQKADPAPALQPPPLTDKAAAKPQADKPDLTGTQDNLDDLDDLDAPQDEEAPPPNWSKIMSKAAASRKIGVSVDKIDDHLRQHPEAILPISRQCWQFDKNRPLFSRLP